MLARSFAGLIAAAAIAALARRSGSLSSSGALAAAAIGTMVVAAGWAWGAMLLLFFASSLVLSRVRRADRHARTAGVTAKEGARDARQVIANGGILAACALASAFASPHASAVLALAALGALSAATADTWATEIGTAVGGTPRSVVSLRPVRAGMSGGVTIAGTLAMLLGAATMALAARSLALTPDTAIVMVAGTVGAFSDSLIGGTLQVRRWCGACAVATEQEVHECGAATSVAGGLPWCDNDVVNLLATATGAVVAIVLASW